MEAQQEQPKKRGAQKGRIMSDAQREGLKKGLEALKAKREAKAKEKELKKPEPQPQPQPINQPEPINQPLPIINQVPAENPPLVKPKRDRQPKVNVSDLSKFKDDIIGNIREIQSKPAPVEKVIERVIEKPVYLTGSDLLNKIFNFN